MIDNICQMIRYGKRAINAGLFRVSDRGPISNRFKKYLHCQWMDDMVDNARENFSAREIGAKA